MVVIFPKPFVVITNADLFYGGFSLLQALQIALEAMVPNQALIYSSLPLIEARFFFHTAIIA
jgi:hypothetical protein